MGFLGAMAFGFGGDVGPFFLFYFVFLDLHGRELEDEMMLQSE